MSRYIDADKLHNQGWVAARYINWEPTPLNDNFRLEIEVKPFNTFYVADVAEVVRCKECKYQTKGQNECESWNMCEYRSWLHFPVNDDDYCSKGERNE